MSVSEDPIIDSWASDGGLTARSIPFSYIAPEDVSATYTPVDGAPVSLVAGDDYILSGNGRAREGVFTPLVVQDAGGMFQTARRTAIVQAYETEVTKPLSSASVERELDRQTMVNQEQDAAIDNVTDRAFLVPDGETGGVTEPLETRQSRVAWWDITGGLISVSLLSLAAAIAPSLLTVLPTDFKGDPGSAGSAYPSRFALRLAGNDATNLDDARLAEPFGDYIFQDDGAGNADIVAELSSFAPAIVGQQTLIVPKGSDATGASGAWVLQYDVLRPEMLGDVGNGISTTATPVMQAWIDYAIAKEFDRIAASGKYYLPAGTQTVKEYAIAKGDLEYDFPSYYALMADEAYGLEIDLTGADIKTDHGTTLSVYSSVNVKVINGSFVRTGERANVINNQPSAIAIHRSWRCKGVGQYVDGFHRNLFAYRAPDCGFEKYTSIGATYFCVYASGTVDIDIPNSPIEAGDATFHFLNKGYVRGGRYGNIFTDNAEASGNTSVDCATDGNNAAHIKTEQMNVRWFNNVIIESTPQNSGDLIDGISAVPSTVYGVRQNAIISGNKVRGCYRGIWARGLKKGQVVSNNVEGYYQTGIAVVSDSIYDPISDEIKALELSRAVVDDNIVGAMADDSTRVSVGNEKNCGLQIEKNVSTLGDLIVSNNIVDALGDNVTKTPTYNMYVECDEDAVTGLSSNTLVGSLPNMLPTWFYRHDRTPRTKIITASSGTAVAPVAIDVKLYRDGVARCYNSHIELPDAVKDLKITFTSSSATNRIYVKGASSGATGSDTIYVPGVGSATRNISFTGPGAVTFICTVTGVWDVITSGGTVPLVYS